MTHALADSDTVHFHAIKDNNGGRFTGYLTSAAQARRDASRLISAGWVCVTVRAIDHDQYDPCHAWRYVAPNAFLGIEGGWRVQHLRGYCPEGAHKGAAA